MVLKIDNVGLNIFPAVEAVDARDAGREVEVVLLTRVEGQSAPVVLNLTYKQAADLSKQLSVFGK